MKQIRYTPACTIGLAAALALLAGCGSNSPQPPAVEQPAAALPPGAATCAALASSIGNTSLFPAQTAITSAKYVPASAASGTTPALPEHCNVVGTLRANRAGAESSPGVAQSYTINWQVRLPTVWNSRFAMQGGGGLDGSVPDTTARLALGYATAANDSGHDNTRNNDPLAADAGAFATDPQARTDFAYQAITDTTKIARGLIQTYYGSAQKYSYFEGCSMGGREAMMVSQRLGDQYDGVVAGDPGFKLTGVATHEVYNAQTLASLATSMGLSSMNGVPLMNNTYTNQDLQLVSNAVLSACDGLDGLKDGMINQPLKCTTPVVTPALNALQCTGAKNASCLTANQIDTLQKIYAGPITPTGKQPYYGWMWDAGIAGCTSAADCNTPAATNIATNWRQWKLGTYQTNLSTAVNNSLDFTGGAGGALSTVLAQTPPQQPAATAAEGLTRLMLGYDLDAFYARTFATSAKFPISAYDQLQADSTDLSALTRHGGKLIVWQPQSGGPFSPLAMIDWYQKLNIAAGGNPVDYTKAQAFARLFMMPGAQHCGGGPATSTIDPLTSVVAWVENGVAPASLIGTAPSSTPWPGRTRPLCPFPQTAQYNGTGDINSAGSFSCK